MIKVFISPTYNHPDKGDGGIRRVVEAELKHLPKFDIEVVYNIHQADVIQTHGSMLVFHPDIPIVNSNHGLYWSRQGWGAGYQQVNKEVVQAMCRAVAHTVPSEWVSVAVRRGGFFYPEVVYHGVDAEDFQPAEFPGKYVLWNKARADYVSDPKDMQTIAGFMPDISFRTTVGQATQNVNVIGVMKYSEMKSVVANAGVYLCTARETFGIGTLEAMASGVPVAGWDWGGQREIIIPGETGYLAPPGNYELLAECIRKCLEDRERLSKNCLEDVRARWGWEKRIKQYAELFQWVHNNYCQVQRPRVSIIITAYKLDAYLPRCLDSVLEQTVKDFDCVVIDDAQQKSTRTIVEKYSKRDPRIRYIPTPHNFGLVGARNFGLENVNGKYIRHLDADDYLAPNALEIEANALDQDPDIHITYGHLEMINEDGSPFLTNGKQVRSGWPHDQFNWLHQMAHLNQIPSCAMLRRDVLIKSGGYRERMKRQEDAEFWCRVTSLGFRASKCTQAVTYYHRMRDDSKGAVEWKVDGSEPDWTMGFPWRVGSKNVREAVNKLKEHSGEHPNPELVPFGAQGKSPVGEFWYVHDYAYPVVSIIVTCGPGHKSYLIDALDSIQAQTFPDWECIVVNDTGSHWGKNILGAPWAKVLNIQGNQGVANARNEGVKCATGKYIVWMDADDYWLPWFLELMIAFAERNRGIIYSDLIMDDGKEKKAYRYHEFEPAQVPHRMSYPGSSVLIPRQIVDAVVELQGGWDSKIVGMEDWDYQIAMHHLGFCAYHIPEPLFVYRTFTSTKRESDYTKIDEIEDYLTDKWAKYRKEGVIMSCGCGGKTAVKTKPVSRLTSSGNFQTSEEMTSSEDMTKMVEVEYVGPLTEDFSIRSRVSRDVNYRFGNNQYNKIRTVFIYDALWMVTLLDGDAKPMYRIIGSMGAENRDPSVVVGAVTL